MRLKTPGATAIYTSFIFFLFLSVLLISCGKEDVKDVKSESDSKPKKENAETKSGSAETKQSSPGRELFYAKSKENNIACADCHGDGSNTSSAMTKYFSNVAGADKRTSTYHGKFTGAEVAAHAGGATVCWEAYMKMKTPLTPEQITALNQYYASLPSADVQAEVKYETIALPKPDKAKLKIAQKNVMSLTGNASDGEKKFNDACGICHGQNKTVRKTPDIFDDFDGNVKSITYNVRFGDGAMPFYKEKDLSDQDVADIAAYILKMNNK